MLCPIEIFWRPGIGDPTVMGWFTVFLSFLVCDSLHRRGPLLTLSSQNNAVLVLTCHHSRHPGRQQTTRLSVNTDGSWTSPCQGARLVSQPPDRAVLLHHFDHRLAAHLGKLNLNVALACLGLILIRLCAVQAYRQLRNQVP